MKRNITKTAGAVLALVTAFPPAALLAADENAEAENSAEFRDIAAKAIREAAEKAAKDQAEWEKSARETAEKTAKEAVEDAIKKAVEKAAKDAAEAAAKAAAEKAAKEMTDEKAAKEEAKAEKEERKEERRQIDTRIFRLNHASAEEVAQQFNTMWSGEFGVNWKLTKIAVAFPESNSIMITAPRVILEACEKSIRALDVEAQQVYIEARFVELGNTASHKVGIDWAFLDGVTLTGSAGASLNSTTIGDGVTEYSKTLYNGKNTETYKLSGTKTSGGGDNGDVTYFNGTLNLSQMAMTLKLLDSTGDTKTFSNPKIIVSSGKKATVDMTTKYPNVKISTKRTTGTSDSVDIASNLEAIPGEDKFMFAKEAFFSWGISLEVTPRISTNGLINVSIVPTISALEDWVETGTSDTSGDAGGTVSTKYPQIKVQRLITEFSLANGMTAVIGGLSITEETQKDNGIPVLREIPWIGTRWFGSMERVKEQKEIIVFVTVGLVDPRKVPPDAGLPKNAILGRQYTKGQKLEPGDRPERNMEGFDSLDMRPLEEQAKDPLQKKVKPSWSLDNFNLFRKDPNYKRTEDTSKERTNP